MFYSLGIRQRLASAVPDRRGLNAVKTGKEGHPLQQRMFGFSCTGSPAFGHGAGLKSPATTFTGNRTGKRAYCHHSRSPGLPEPCAFTCSLNVFSSSVSSGRTVEQPTKAAEQRKRASRAPRGKGRHGESVRCALMIVEPNVKLSESRRRRCAPIRRPSLLASRVRDGKARRLFAPVSRWPAS